MYRAGREAWWVPLLVGSVCLLFLAGCDGSTPAPTPTAAPVELDDVERVRVYQAVVAALLGDEQPLYVYISPYAGDGERLDNPNESRPLPDGLLPALQSGETGPVYEMLDFAEAIGPLEEGGEMQNGGVFITLGPLESDPGEAGAVAVRGSLYRRVGSAEGFRFRLQPDELTTLGWRVVEAQEEWNDE